MTTSTSNKCRLLLAAVALCTLSSSANADLVTGTILVNFHNGSPTATTAADYQSNHADVVSGTNVVSHNPSDVATDDIIGMTGNLGADFVVDTTITSDNRTFTAGGGPHAGTAITDSYIAVRNNPVALTISSLDEVVDGTNVTLVVYAVGDNGNQDGDVIFTYNGASTAAGDHLTEADGTTGDAFTTYTFTKVAGVDSLDISNDGPDQWQGVNGFSLTATVDVPSAAVPEPSAMMGLCMLAGVGVIRRRRR